MYGIKGRKKTLKMMGNLSATATKMGRKSLSVSQRTGKLMTKKTRRIPKKIRGWQ